MGATKIIHVLKNDGFEEVFDLFKNCEAEEVIFIFPKGSRFAKQEQYFEAIKNEADASGKLASIMSSDPVIAQFATRHGLNLLGEPNGKSKERQPKATTAEQDVAESAATPVFGEQDDGTPTPYNEPGPEAVTAIAQDEIDTDGEAVLTASRGPFTGAEDGRDRKIRDILRSDNDHPVKIKEERGGDFQVNVKSHIQPETEEADDITKVWARREAQEKRGPDVNFLAKLKFSKKSGKRLPVVLIAGAVFILLVIIYGALGNAKITIKPQKQNFDFQLKVTASSTAGSISPEFSRVPGQRFSAKEEESGAFPATGQKNIVQKASGKITIFNKTFASQRLVATTRFKTPEGLIFRIPQTIEVPAAVKSGAGMREGSIESAVYADRAGPEYNIGPSQFTIPGFEGTPKVDQFYAKSDSPMKGGITGLSKVITEEDFAKAQETLTATVKDKILKSLKNQAGEFKILDSTAVKIDMPVTNAKVGEGAENLQMTVKGSADTIAFRESDITELVDAYVKKTGDLELLTKDLAVTYANPQINADGAAMLFTAQVSAMAVAKIDQEKILKDIGGMGDTAIRAYFAGIKEIESARITLSPFWVRSVPKNPAKVRLVIEKE